MASKNKPASCGETGCGTHGTSTPNITPKKTVALPAPQPAQNNLRVVVRKARTLYPEGNAPGYLRYSIRCRLEKFLFAERPYFVAHWGYSPLTPDDIALHMWTWPKTRGAQPYHPAEGPPFNPVTDWLLGVPRMLALQQEQEAARKARFEEAKARWVK